uniref:uncharacterized protein LOC122598538 isoform X2 n=1 Tax=Erigeron canadensis TaxID=72917 RepID=UPI001CB9818A|nr:uncharacterized protein LOC122598538 isoform X2 [Erigeron canadensis]
MATTRYHIHILVFVFIWTFSYGLQDDACRILGCGEGRCVEDHDGSSSYHCECNHGWKTIKVAPMPFPSCIVPNCTTDLPCGGKAPIPPPPPPQPPLNVTNVCSLVWCGDGYCVANGNKHYYCRCHDDAAAFLHSNFSICLKQCTLKEDCTHLGFGLVKPPSLLPPPPPSSSGSFNYRKNKVVAYTLTQPIHIIVILMATGFAID